MSLFSCNSSLLMPLCSSADSPRQTLKFVVGASLKAALAKLPAVVPTVEESKSSGDATDKGEDVP